MSLLDVPLLARLQAEFRLSMKRLMGDLCLDLESHYADVAKSLALPVAYFRFTGKHSSGMRTPTGKSLAGSRR